MERTSVPFVFLLFAPACCRCQPHTISWLDALQQVAITLFCARPT